VDVRSLVSLPLSSHLTVQLILYQIGNTPLMDACGNGHYNVIPLLLDRGAEINLQNKVPSLFLSSLYCILFS
jgi:ankyrin repeat protein